MITNACVRCGGAGYTEDGETKCLNCGAVLDYVPAVILDTVKEQRGVVGRGRRKGVPLYGNEEI